VRVLSVSVTDAGRALAARLPFEHVHGSAAATVRRRWGDVDAFVLFCATGAAVRIVAPLLADKRRDPAVVCVDDAGRFAVALCGAHERGGNALARRVAAALGATPVVTTAAEAHDPPPPPPVAVVAGVGASTDACVRDVEALLDAALADAGCGRDAVVAVATIDRRAADPAVTDLGLPVVAYPAERLATVPVPSPSEAVRRAVGTPSVAEAAALLAAGSGGRLLVRKRASTHATVALACLPPATAKELRGKNLSAKETGGKNPSRDPATTAGVDTDRRSSPRNLSPDAAVRTDARHSRSGRGVLTVVGIGPGSPRHRTPAAADALGTAEVVVGYEGYLDQAADLVAPGADVLASPIGAEVDRAERALAAAAGGRRVALVCSGDPGVYGMASLALELGPELAPDVEITVVPGVTAALAAAAALGAPLGHDHAVVSLSDLLTPWPVIEVRLRAAAAADFVVALYNPRSSRRTWQLQAARRILLAHRSPTTPVGVVTAATRPDQSVTLTTLADLDPASVGMASLVIVGASQTRVAGGRMVTPRGYRR
jgi:cobalt-precorrin 5A hydrolase/precorrin-3B C17-methyltransferase